MLMISGLLSGVALIHVAVCLLIDVRPFSVYAFAVVSCTSVGCTNSSTTSITTPQRQPTGNFCVLCSYFFCNMLCYFGVINSLNNEGRDETSNHLHRYRTCDYFIERFCRATSCACCSYNKLIKGET